MVPDLVMGDRKSATVGRGDDDGVLRRARILRPCDLLAEANGKCCGLAGLRRDVWPEDHVPELTVARHLIRAGRQLMYFCSKGCCAGIKPFSCFDFVE